MKRTLIKDLIEKFYYKDRHKFYFLIFLSLIAGVFEYLGLVLIFQFVLFVSNPNIEYSKQIIAFFQNHLNISDFSTMSFILGLFIALIYIFKNIYMLIFTKINDAILEDLSQKMVLKVIKNLLFQDFITVNSISEEEKLNILQKITIVVFQYCYKYINLITNCAIIVILAFYLYFKFTQSAIIATIFMAVLSFIEYKYLKSRSNYQNKYFTKTFDELNKNLYTVIYAIKEIKLEGNEDYFTNKIENSYKKYSELNKDRCFNNVFHIYFTEISIMFTFIILLAVLFHTSNFENGLLISSISTICVIILRLTPAINRAQSALYSINSNEKAVSEILNFDNLFKDDINYIQTKEKLPFNSSIKLKNVSFSYPNNKQGLKNINLEIKKGDFIGITGVSGCYKTTLSLIIAGLIKQTKGKILIDDVELKKDDIKKWQNNIALLGQELVLFDDYYKNISKNLKQKLDLDVKKKKRNLSTGQKQRTALAIVLEQNKDVIILDEATSSNDVINEEKINNILKDLKGKKTIISIAHRLRILKHCTKIIYMEKGRIIDIDTFKNLKEKYKDFRKMIKLSNFKV